MSPTSRDPVTAIATPPRAPFSREEIEGAVAARFENIVRLFPNRPAITAGGKTLTYRELDQTVTHLARALRDRRGEDEARVILLLDHGLDMVAAIFAALKAGLTYIPLDPAYPASRLAFIAHDAEPHLVLTCQTHLPLARAMAGPTCALLTIEEARRAARPDIPLPPPDPTHPAALYYTSGSTGRPKGVIYTNRFFLHKAWAYHQDDHVGPTDRCSLLFSFAFAASTSEMFTAMLNGAALCLYDLHEAGFADFSAWLTRERLTLLHPPVAFFRRFLQSLSPSDHFPTPRLAILGGDSITWADVALFRSHFPPGCVLVHQLAASETNPIARHRIAATAERAEGTRVPVGLPVHDKKVTLLDEHGREVEAGQAGEIVVTSRYLASGYWRQPDLTARKFRDVGSDGERAFYTGDFGRWLPGGNLLYLGRRDAQVKVRGYRVDLLEVEGALRSLPTIREAVVAAEDDDADGKRLAAYLVADPPTPTPETLRRELGRTLPGYAIPGRFTIVDRLPLTPSGKLDRAALRPSRPPEPPAPASSLGDDIEHRLQRIWSEVFHPHPVRRDDSFLDLGGHSLAAARIVDRIRKAWSLDLPLSALFQAPTIVQLATVIRTRRLASSWSYLTPVRAEGTRPPLYGIPGAGSDVSTLGDIFRHLPPDQPFYGFQPRGMDGLSEPHATVEDAARAYVEELLQAQPAGPYFLVGASSGGCVAVEMARELLARNRSVGLVALLDTHGPGHPALRDDLTLFRRIAFFFRRLRPRGAREQTDWATLLLGLKEKSYRIRTWLAVQRHRRSGRPLDYLHRIFYVRRAWTNASKNYNPPPYPGDILLFRAQHQPSSRYYRTDPLLGWAAVVRGRIEVVDVPGHHNDLRQGPNVRHVTAELARRVGGPEMPE